MASIIGVGNPGVGKSTILNSLAEELLFKSGTSFGKGLTFQMDERSNENGRFFDTPGLADRKLREQAGQAITQTLKNGGNFKILFFLRTESGRAVGEDITTFKLVLDSVPEIGNHYGVVINKVSSKLAKQFLENTKHKEAFLTDIFTSINPQRRCNLSNIVFLPLINEVEDEDDIVIPLKDLKSIEGRPFKNYIDSNMPSVRLTKGKAKDIATQDFDKATEEIETLKREQRRNQRMFEKKQKEMEQKMIQNAAKMKRKAEAQLLAQQQAQQQAEQQAQLLAQQQAEERAQQHAQQLAQQQAQLQEQLLAQRSMQNIFCLHCRVCGGIHYSSSKSELMVQCWKIF